MSNTKYIDDMCQHCSRDIFNVNGLWLHENGYTRCKPDDKADIYRATPVHYMRPYPLWYKVFVTSFAIVCLLPLMALVPVFILLSLPWYFFESRRVAKD